MEACQRCAVNIAKTTNCASDQCAEDGTLMNAEFVGFLFDESTEYDYIPMLDPSPMVSQRMKELEYDISGMNSQAQKDLESIAFPADELLYKAELVPLHLPLRIQRLEKLLASEIKPLEPHARTGTESIFSNCTTEEEELGFATLHKSCDVAPCKIDKDCKQTCSKGSAPVLYRNKSKKLLGSTQSQQTTLVHKFRASGKYLKSLFSKASRLTDHHSRNNSIQRESSHHDDAATVGRSSHRENSSTTHRKSFSGSFSLVKGFPLLHKPNPRPFSASNGVTPAHSSTFLKRGMVSLDVENNIQEAIAHCKQSYSADPKNAINTSIYVQQNGANPEGFADGHVHDQSWSDPRITACDSLEKLHLGPE